KACNHRIRQRPPPGLRSLRQSPQEHQNQDLKGLSIRREEHVISPARNRRFRLIFPVAWIHLGPELELVAEFVSSSGLFVVQCQESIARPFRCPGDMHRMTISSDIKPNSIHRRSEMKSLTCSVNDDWAATGSRAAVGETVSRAAASQARVANEHAATAGAVCRIVLDHVLVASSDAAGIVATDVVCATGTIHNCIGGSS